MKYRFIRLIVIFVLFKTMLSASNWDFLSIHGYGTVGIAYQDDKDVIYRNSFHTNKGSRGDLSLSNYSNFGLQLEAMATDDIMFTVQGIVSENNSGNKLAELGWANVQYQINDDLSIKAGRMRIPSFMYSDILDVSFAYDWVKLPEMYGIIPFHNYNGVELNYNLDFNDISLLTTLMYGSSESKLVVDENNNESGLRVKEMKGVSVKLMYEDLTLRFAYNTNNLRVDDDVLEARVEQLYALGIPQVTAALNKYIPDEVRYWEIGGRYDFEDVYLVGEYMEINSDSFLSNNKSWYIGTGYNFEKWAPYILYSKSSSTTSYEDIATNNLMPFPMIAAITSANQGLGSLSELNSIVSEIKSVGMRYSVNENMILKFQYDKHKELKADGMSFGFGQDPNIDLDVFSATMNFVF